ncbi:MAG: hypothetical protein U1E05_07330, partial [Patescibacteria group bacterium]|nr:hypothetical protein [Patescibacteria group bacterium]
MTSILKRARSIGGSARRWCALPLRAKAEGWRDRLTGLGSDPGIDRCMDEALGWLLRAQDHSRSAD